ncbi:MAG: hypothetical protein QF464_09335, partial [Myxococcota bacterium]|nr:hypothetical protein [Myxococcota bacterium]
ADGEPCVPESACAPDGICHDGLCVGSDPPDDCDDGDPCTTDTCDEETGCEHAAILDCDVAACASQAAEFDGASCVEVPGFLSEGLPTYTIEFWFLALSNDGPACILDKVTPGAEETEEPDRGWQVRYNNLPSVWESSIHYEECKVDGNLHGLLTTDAYPPAEWHHYALVRTETGLMRRFVDGVSGGLSQFNADKFVPLQSSPESLWIGCRDQSELFLHGRVDELRISAGERYTAAFTPPTAPLGSDEATLLLYHFDDANDGVVVDSSGLDHHGTWHGTDLRPLVSPVESCDDGDPCTLDTCEESGCSHATDPCDDGDPCTADSCGEGGCAHIEDLDGDGCAPPEPCEEEVKVGCGGSCCCFEKSHTLDLGVIVEPGTEVECCIRPGLNCGCTGDAVFEVSSTGVVWETVATFETVSDKVGGVCPNEAVARVDHCETFTATESYQQVRGTHDICYNDKFECTIPGTDCDDGNRCTLDSCDQETDTCVHVPITGDDTCLVVYHGNNLIGFHALPEDDASVPAVFGDLADHSKQLWSEGVVAHRLSTGEWVGNYRELERWRGYWLIMDLSGGNFYDTPSMPVSTAIPLDGVVTPPDLRYPLHAGWNMISFTGPETTDIAGAVDEADQGLFESFIGAGIGLFKDELGVWMGSLTFMNWRGYETKVIDGIDAFTFMWGVEVGAPSDLVYGCTHPSATNVDPAAEVGDQSCVYDLPEGWSNPTWQTVGSMKRPQMFTVFQSPSVGGAPLELVDAIGAFVDGANVGFGFPDDAGYVTVPALNVAQDSEVTFQIY